MNHSKFTVVFTNHNFEIVWAFCKKEAIILAQAKQINKGCSYNVAFVKDEEGNVLP